MPYQVCVYKILSSLGYTLHVFYLDKHTQTPYIPPQIRNVQYYAKSKFSKVSLLMFIRKFKAKTPCNLRLV